MKRKMWTPEEDLMMRENYPHMSIDELRPLFPDRTSGQIYNRAFTLGIKKTPEALEKARELSNNKLIKSGEKYRFKPGSIPMNKGMKQEEYMTQEGIRKSKETRFKKGQKPHNTKEDLFTVRNDKNGHRYVYRKLEDSHWVLYHRWLWEQSNGPIPKGVNVQFKDGNSLNITLDNLELVTRKESMQRNTIHNLPPELKELKLLVKKLNGRINKKVKKLNHDQ